MTEATPRPSQGGLLPRTQEAPDGCIPWLPRQAGGTQVSSFQADMRKGPGSHQCPSPQEHSRCLGSYFVAYPYFAVYNVYFCAQMFDEKIRMSIVLG